MCRQNADFALFLPFSAVVVDYITIISFLKRGGQNTVHLGPIA
jgi:hypothetical protein